MKLKEKNETSTQTQLKKTRKKYIVFRAIRTVLLGLIAIAIFLAVYFAMIDRASKPVIKEGMNYEIETEEFNGRNVFIVSQKGEEKSSKTILYLHGGAYIEEMSGDYWPFIEKIVNDTNAKVIIPDYPLAPKYNYQDVFNMIEPLYKEIIEKVDLNNFILMGDSAGGGMSLALLEKINEQELTNPSKTILISPWLDVTMENKKIDEVQKNDTMLNKEVLKIAGIAYAKDVQNTKNYLVSPIYGNLSKLKNVMIFTGTYDILNPDAHELVKKAEEQNVNIDLKEYESAKHIWIVTNNTDEEITKKAYQDLKNEIESINNQK